MQVMIFFSALMSHCLFIKNKGKATIFVSVTRNSNSTDKREVDRWAHFTPLSPSVIHFKGTVKFRKIFEGLIFGGAYIRRGLFMEGNLRFKIDWACLIVGGKFTVFALFYFVFEGNFQVQAPGGLIFEGVI